LIWFTSDTHFGHKNIIEYCKRPFRTREGMNEALIRRWNDCVKPEDEVYHLGDVSFVNQEWTGSILRKLNGNIYHIAGNHDKKLKTDRFAWSRDEFQGHFEEAGASVYMSHHYHDDWPDKDIGAWHLHGHAHGNLPYVPGSRRLDVGVDVWNFRPVSILQVKEFFEATAR